MKLIQLTLKKIKRFKIDNFYFFAVSKIPTNSFEKKICYKSNFKILSDFLVFFSINFKKSKLLYLSSGEIFGENKIISKKKIQCLKLIIIIVNVN